MLPRSRSIRTPWTDVRRFDAQALYRALDQQRVAQGLSWAAVARQVGVSAAMLTGTRDGGRLEVDGVLAMVGWQGVPLEHFVRRVPPK